MKKYITAFAIALLVIAGLWILYWSSNRYYTYDSIKLHRKLIKETVVNYSDTSEEFRRYGIFKRVYRKYDYPCSDSVYGGYQVNDTISVACYTNDIGDTIYEAYINTSNYPHR